MKIPVMMTTVLGGRARYKTLSRYLAKSLDLIEDFEAIADWTAVNCSIDDNTDQFATGSHSVKLTVPIDYIYSKRNAITPITISEYYRLNSENVTVQLP